MSKVKEFIPRKIRLIGYLNTNFYEIYPSFAGEFRNYKYDLVKFIMSDNTPDSLISNKDLLACGEVIKMFLDSNKIINHILPFYASMLGIDKSSFYDKFEPTYYMCFTSNDDIDYDKSLSQSFNSTFANFIATFQNYIRNFEDIIWELGGVQINIYNLLLCGLFELITHYNEIDAKLDIYNTTTKYDDFSFIATEYIVEKSLDLLTNTFGKVVDKFAIACDFWALFYDDKSINDGYHIMDAVDYFKSKQKCKKNDSKKIYAIKNKHY